VKSLLMTWRECNVRYMTRRETSAGHYNVDRLHHAAGSTAVLELHGTTHEMGWCRLN